MKKVITLDQQIAYLLRNPITKPSDMPTPLKTKPIDTEWQVWIDGQWWAKKNTYDKLTDAVDDDMKKLKSMLDLRAKLLSFGGSEVCMVGYDEDADNIVNRGQLWYGDRIHMMRGQPSQCHRNSSYCWEANQDKTVLCTGYALSESGMWRCHSWLVELRPRKNRIVETTVPRVAYFGFGMTNDEAWKFYFDNE